MRALKPAAIRILASITPLLAAAGCLLPGTPVTLPDLPAELQAVWNDPDAFEPDPNNPLSDVAVGTPLDDLDGLTGCWGSFEPADRTSSGALATGFYEVYQFDGSAGTATRWALSPGVVAIPPLLAIDQGTFSALGNGRLEIRLERFTVVDARTGLGREFTGLPEDVAVMEKLVTLDGDLLSVADSDSIDAVTGEPLGRVFSRFSCPD